MFVVVVVFVTLMIKSPLMGIILHIFVWRLRQLGATNARCSICFLKNSMWKYILLQRNLVVAFGRKPMVVIDGFLNVICLMTQRLIWTTMRLLNKWQKQLKSCVAKSLRNSRMQRVFLVSMTLTSTFLHMKLNTLHYRISKNDY